MIFPSISEIATTSVVYVHINASVSEAMKMMFESEHRNVIVVDKGIFRILRVCDILHIKAQKIDLQVPLKELELCVVPTVNKDKTVLHTLEHLGSDIEYICAVNDDGSLYGIITHTDITSSIDPDTLMDNFSLHDYLKLGKRAKWIKRGMKTSDLLEEMIAYSFESVMIVEDLKPIGIFTTKDVIRIIGNDEDLSLPIDHYMSSPVDTINKNSSVKEALEFLKKKRYKRVVVVDDEGKMFGIISQKELISLTYSKWAMIIKEYQKELNQINSALLSKSKKYETMASADPLTGLYNRAKFSELFDASYQSMIEKSTPLSLIILDIDNFKPINDTYGHNVGDKVIVEFSQSLEERLRNADIVCRWGGEEFVVLLPGVDLDNAFAVAEKLRVLIEESKIDTVGAITASFGVAEVREEDDLHSVVERADSALYEAKASGRNCVKKA